jgi:hypothetical protein
MMLYAALTFWLLVIVFSAWGVHRLWSNLVKPRVVNGVLLPGTLIAQLGHVLGLFLTGNSVRNATLMGDDERGEPHAEGPERQRIPVLGPIIVGLLPLVACGVCLYVAALLWGRRVWSGAVGVPQALPLSLSGVWDLLRDSITLVEALVDQIIASGLFDWATLLFLYLAICLTVRMAPFEGNRRGAIGAIFLAGIVIAVVDALPLGAGSIVLTGWPVLSFAVAMLLFLLLFSLLVTGIVGLVRILVRRE